MIIYFQYTNSLSNLTLLSQNLSTFVDTYLIASTGSLFAARQLCQLTVSNSIPKNNKPTRMNIYSIYLI